jgi:hypothetical protein
MIRIFKAWVRYKSLLADERINGNTIALEWCLAALENIRRKMINRRKWK